jgi:hypothetical protein
MPTPLTRLRTREKIRRLTTGTDILCPYFVCDKLELAVPTRVLNRKNLLENRLSAYLLPPLRWSLVLKELGK